MAGAAVSVLVALVAQCLHIVLLALAAPTAMGVLGWTEARLAGRHAPSWRAPWQDLARLRRKQMVVAENASPLFTAAPLVSFAAVAVAAALVPSFTTGMLFAPLSDLLVIGGLLALARLTLLLAVLDEGTAAGGVAARQGITLALGAEPGLLLVVLALGLAAGTTNVNLIAGLQQAQMVQPLPGVVLAAAALVLLAVVQRDIGMPEAAAFSAAGLGLLRMTEALRLLVWIDLLGALFVPVGMASARDFPSGWVVGLAAWAIRLAVAIGLLAGLRVAAGRLAWRRVPALLLVSLALALLAGLLVLSRARPV